MSVHALFPKQHKSVGIIIGDSPSLKGFPLWDLKSESSFTIRCNRGLLQKKFRPDYYMVADREPYTQMRDSGLLHEAIKSHTKVMLSRTIFDAGVRCLRFDGKDEIKAQPLPNFSWYPWRVDCRAPIQFDTFDKPLYSFSNIAGPMLQAAVILGAKVVGCVGIDLEWPKNGPSHFYGDGKKYGAYEFRKSSFLVSYFNKAKKLAEARGIKIFNLSPWRDTPFSTVFGNYPFDKFCEEHCK